MNGDIEELVLSGKLFNPGSRPTSPTRSRSRSPSPSPSPAPWPTPDADYDYDYDSDAERRRAADAHAASPRQESIGMGPGRTGVKGVIRDHAEAAALARSKRAQEIVALNRAMEKASLGGKTWAEEERERERERVAGRAQLGGKASRLMEGSGARAGRFGHLMEVGVRSFVQAVEEDRTVWVLVHIYDPSLDRCAALDDTLSRLARTYPSTKFLRARAGALGFATGASASASAGSQHYLSTPFPLRHSHSRQMLVPGRYPADADDDDPFGEDDDSDSAGQEQEDGWEDDAVDRDVLPTLLVYRGGELEHAWVRVDWEAKTGIEDLLKRCVTVRAFGTEADDDHRHGAFLWPFGFYRHSILSDSDVHKRAGDGGDVSDDEDFDDGELVFGGSDDDC
ncbi:hypothetical protein AcV5_003104 [Taiwanofungus camphoratus]|nr:hypothetical protein AcV5_003104 [Antrodia cinnamomea]